MQQQKQGENNDNVSFILEEIRNPRKKGISLQSH